VRGLQIIIILIIKLRRTEMENVKFSVCWIWTAFCYAFQRSSISVCLSEFFWCIHFTFSSPLPLPRKSIRQMVVFEEKKCKRS